MTVPGPLKVTRLDGGVVASGGVGRGVQKMKMRLLGLGLGSVLTLAGVMVPAVAASADSSCYTGCTPTLPSGHVPVTTDAKAVTVSSTALAFTGADIEEMTAFGGGALVLGGVLVRRSRRRNRANA
jgi:hypothetical protein